MSASNKSWLMLGGLALSVAGLIYATKQFKGRTAPPAEIAPAPTTTEVSTPVRSQAQLPTILRAKPITENEPSASPRYTPREPNALDNGQFDRVRFDEVRVNNVPTGGYPLPGTTRPGTTRPGTTRPGTTGSPALGPVPGTVSPGPTASSGRTADSQSIGSPHRPPAADEQTALPEASDESAASSSAEVPKTYVTIAEDSFWNISKRRYGGEGRFFKALYYHNRNRIVRPDRIPAGIEIDTPPLAELKRLYPDLCGVGRRR